MNDKPCNDGHCEHCRFWQSDAAGDPAPHTVGLCLHDDLAHFQLQVTEDSGCNRFELETVDHWERWGLEHPLEAANRG